MTTTIKDQNCGNCAYARRVSYGTTNTGKAGVQQSSAFLQCRYNPPPWYPVKPEDWCKEWDGQ